MSLINHPFHHPKPKGSFIFATEDYVRKGGHEDRYDEYFFLKLFDISRTTYVRNPLSHKQSAE